ncbi:hypothetical protein VVR46_08090 [Corynebacterium phoceense]|uniref:hypothetical protein n=1 Tax=Corynebacterium phoceense TaxID=1686286 RepID=UPI0034CFC775
MTLEEMITRQLGAMPRQVEITARLRAEIVARVVRWVRLNWRAYEQGDPLEWFDKHALEFHDIVTQAQLEAATVATIAVDETLAAQGYNGPTDFFAVPEAFAGYTGAGLPVMGLAYAQALKVAETIDAGADQLTIQQNWNHAAVMLQVAAQTAVSDSSRQAKLVHMAARPRTKWIRLVRPPCCARCAILAGKVGYHMDFKRHPGCDCDAIPLAEWDDDETNDARRDWIFDPNTYFDSLTEAQQDKIFTKAGAQAVRDGADINQVVNARRGMTTAGKRPAYTLEGTTKRGVAASYLRESYRGYWKKLPGSRYQRFGQRRLTPEAIYDSTRGDPDLALSLLHANGYLSDASANLDGSWRWAVRDSAVRRARDKVSDQLVARGLNVHVNPAARRVAALTSKNP